MLPASVYREEEYREAPERQRESRRRQIMNGIEVAKGYRLKLFPVWYDFRGNFGVLLSEAKGLSAAAQLRGNLDAEELGQRQLEWVVGRNPFAESTMYGEGYNYVPYFSPASGDIVGALPVGIETSGDDDAPYWPASASYVYKEVWVHPVARWISLLTDLSGPASISGRAGRGRGGDRVARGGDRKGHYDPSRFAQRRVSRLGAGGQVRRPVPRGRERDHAAAGRQLQHGPRSGGVFSISPSAARRGPTAMCHPDRRRGAAGAHRFAVRADNLSLPAAERSAGPRPEARNLWEGKVNALDAPWVAVVVPDGDLCGRKEAIGAVDKNRSPTTSCPR